MTTEQPQKGDKVSWSWGGGAPAGTVAETQEEGEIAIKSKRGNTIKKNASPDNPAVRIERSGNDVVKRASELTVDEKAAENKNEDDHGQGQRGSKRKAESQEVVDDEADEKGNETGEASGSEHQHAINKQGKEVRKGGKDANKRQKTRQNGDVKGRVDDAKTSKQDNQEEETEEKGRDREDTDEEEEEENKEENARNEKPKHANIKKKTANMKKIEVDLNKYKGKKSTQSKRKAKKGPVSRADDDLVSARTRSHGKAA